MDMELTFQGVYQAYTACRKRKRATANAQRYDMNLLEHLVDTEQAIRQRRYCPATSICFVAQQPKAREIYAADFSDRVVHHWLVPRLEVLYEPMFIHDVYSNRKDKGTHKAVKRLQGFMRSLCSQRNDVFFLQLDIKNFFNSINREILYGLLKKRLAKSQRNGKITVEQQNVMQWLCWRILTHNSASKAINKSHAWQWANVPPHKRLENAAPKCGLPIGNLTSQFFANVYLNELDQFVKHDLKCRYYLRYVDDFILLSDDKAELLQWQGRIVNFLTQCLQLHLKTLARPQSVYQGADFLGYITRPDYRLVRRRVINHCRHKLHLFEEKTNGRPTSNVQRPTSNVQRPTSNVQRPTSNVQRPTSKTSNVQRPTSNVQRPTSNVQRPTSNVQPAGLLYEN